MNKIERCGAWMGAAILTALPVGAAYAYWNPPGNDDPCDSPIVLCLGGGALDMDNMTGAACAIGEESERLSDANFLFAFIDWMASLNPPIEIPEEPSDPEEPNPGDPPSDPEDPSPEEPAPEDPPPSDDPDDSDTEQHVCTDTTVTTENGTFRVMLVRDAEFVAGVRSVFEDVPEGSDIQIGPYTARVMYKREAYPSQPDEYRIVLRNVAPTQWPAPALTLEARDGAIAISMPLTAY